MDEYDNFFPKDIKRIGSIKNNHLREITEEGSKFISVSDPISKKIRDKLREMIDFKDRSSYEASNSINLNMDTIVPQIIELSRKMLVLTEFEFRFCNPR